jgi:hypothetical protein
MKTLGNIIWIIFGGQLQVLSIFQRDIVSTINQFLFVHNNCYLATKIRNFELIAKLGRKTPLKNGGFRAENLERICFLCTFAMSKKR